MGAVSEISVRDARQGEGDVDVLASYGFWMPEREAPAQARWSTSVLPVPRPLSPILPSCFAMYALRLSAVCSACPYLRYRYAMSRDMRRKLLRGVEGLRCARGGMLTCRAGKESCV